MHTKNRHISLICNISGPYAHIRVFGIYPTHISLICIRCGRARPGKRGSWLQLFVSRAIENVSLLVLWTETDRQTDGILDTPTVGASTALPSMGHEDQLCLPARPTQPTPAHPAPPYHPYTARTFILTHWAMAPATLYIFKGQGSASHPAWASQAGPRSEIPNLSHFWLRNRCFWHAAPRSMKISSRPIGRILHQGRAAGKKDDWRPQMAIF